MPTKENKAGQQQPYNAENGEFMSNGSSGGESKKEERNFKSFAVPKTNFNANSGYVGYSMSRRAAEAYENDEKPRSQWTKDEIIDAVLNINHDIDKNLIKKFSVNDLRLYFLERTSWHHTGKFYNKTDFYSIDEDKAKEWSNDQIKTHFENQKKARAEKIALKDKIAQKKKEDEILNNYVADISYIEWINRRPYKVDLKGIKVEEKGNWIIFKNGAETIKKKLYNVDVSNYQWTPEQRQIAKKRIDEAYQQSKKERKSWDLNDISGSGFESEKEKKDILNFIEEAYKKDITKPGIETIISKKFKLGDKFNNSLTHDTEYRTIGNKTLRRRQYYIPDCVSNKGDKRIIQDWNTQKYHMEVFNGKEWEKVNNED